MLLSVPKHKPLNFFLFLQSDLQGAPLSEPVYGYQLRKAKKLEDIEFLIDHVVDTRVKKGVHESLVKFLFYPDKFNKWIPTSSMRAGKNSVKQKLERQIENARKN